MAHDTWWRWKISIELNVFYHHNEKVWQKLANLQSPPTCPGLCSLFGGRSEVFAPLSCSCEGTPRFLDCPIPGASSLVSYELATGAQWSLAAHTGHTAAPPALLEKMLCPTSTCYVGCCKSRKYTIFIPFRDAIWSLTPSFRGLRFGCLEELSPRNGGVRLHIAFVKMVYR